MTQRELNRRVADVTGESVRTITSMGFVPLTRHVEEREPRAVDCYPCRKRPATSL